FESNKAHTFTSVTSPISAKRISDARVTGFVSVLEKAVGVGAAVGPAQEASRIRTSAASTCRERVTICSPAPYRRLPRSTSDWRLDQDRNGRPPHARPPLSNDSKAEWTGDRLQKWFGPDDKHQHNFARRAKPDARRDRPHHTLDFYSRSHWCRPND